MRNLQVFNYEGVPVTFQLENGEIMINATQMAKPFGKVVYEYLRLPSTKKLLKAITGKSRISENQLVTSKQGSSELGGGTWLHEEVAVDFAQWLSIEFKLWVNERLRELLKKGVTTVGDDDQAILHAIQVLSKRLEESERMNVKFKIENQKQQAIIVSQAPKVAYHDDVLKSRNVYVVDQIAKELGMTAQKLNRKLKDLGVQFLRNGQWVLKSHYIGKGFTDTRTFKRRGPYPNTVITTCTTVWTEAGRRFIHSLFNSKLTVLPCE